MAAAAPHHAPRVLDVVLAGPTLGAAWVMFLTMRAFAADDDRFMGVMATQIIDVARKHFADDVRGLTWALAGTAIALGAVVGMTAEILVAARREWRGGLATFGRRLVARAVLVIAVYGVIFCFGVARMPQLYAESLYSRQGAFGAVARTAQILVTDVLGSAGVLVLGTVLALAWVMPTGDHVARAMDRVRSGASRSTASFAAPLIAPLVVPLVVLAGVLAGGALAAVAAWSLVSPAPPTKRKGGAPNIVILAVDSLRDDRLEPRTAPRLSGLARDHVRFSRAYVTLPRTLPSWTSILTGREPHRHGLRTMFPRYDDRARDLQALPARLARLGYTSGVVGDYAADIFTRVRYGFDVVDAPTFNFHALIATRALGRATPLLPLLHSRTGRTMMPAMRELNQAADPHMVAADARRALDRLGGGKTPFFLTVFFSTPHFPYAAPAPYYGRFTDPAYRGRFKYHKPNLLGQEGALDDADVKQVRALYDGAVAAVDDAAGEILDDLTRRGLDDDTIVIVTSDHGEMLYEAGHGQGHGDHLFGDQVLHVPLALRLPARIFGAPLRKTIDPLVRDVDLAPTLLDLVGAPPGSFADLDGRSLKSLLAGGGRQFVPRPAFAETEIWMTESIPELPTAGASPLRIPYPNVAQLTELDPRLAYDVVMRPEAEPLVIAAKHRCVIDGDWKLVYVPTRKGARWLLFDRAHDDAEVTDVAAKYPVELARLKDELWKWMLGDTHMEERDGLLVPRRGAEPDPTHVATTIDASALRVK